MKKNLVYLLLFVAICAAAFWLLTNKRTSTLRSELRNFAVADTGAITRIFLADKQGNKILLTRTGNVWMLNEHIEANAQKVNSLLETIKQLEVKSPVPERDYNSVIAELAGRNVKVEIYAGEDLVKTYYVGIQTSDQLGTYMLLENSSVPFIMHIPGFNGHLNTRYFTAEHDWRSTAVFNEPAESIAYIQVDYPAEPNASFVISNDGKQGINIVPLSEQQQALSNPDKQMLGYYLASFRGLNMEGYDQAYSQSKADSVSKLMPYCIIELKTISGKKLKLRVFYKGVDQRTTMQQDIKTGEMMKMDTDRFFALRNDEKELVIIQEFVFGNVFRKYSEFFKKPA